MKTIETITEQVIRYSLKQGGKEKSYLGPQGAGWWEVGDGIKKSSTRENVFEPLGELAEI